MKLLIIGPKFHGYWRSIERAFRELGWDATSHLYDQRSSVSEKALVKLAYELPRRLGGHGFVQVDEIETRRALAVVEAVRPARVLVIKGDRLGAALFDELDARRIPRTLWLYDELRRTRHTDESLGRFDAVATYSRHDAAELGAGGREVAFVPLAFDPGLAFSAEGSSEVTFVGARYPKREAALVGLHEAGVPVRAYGRDWSDHGFDRLRTWRLARIKVPSGRDLSLSDSYGIMAGSSATLNIHGDQDGFTMRTFEASGVGGVQLIDRDDVAEFYDPGTEVVTWASEDELVEHARRAVADRVWGDRIRAAARSRTLADHTFVQRARALSSQW